MDRNSRKAKQRIKMKTNKLMDKITYKPEKHKQKFNKKLRSKLKARREVPANLKENVEFMKFGSFNINGIDLESSIAIEKILEQEDLDVSSYLKVN